MERIEIMPQSYPTNLLAKDWSQRKCYYWGSGVDFLAQVHAMEVRDDDVWLVTLPKCGTTWMQELLWLVLNDYDFERARAEHLEVRTPFLEFDFLLNKNLETSLKPVEALKPPRLIKSHLPLPLLPAQLWHKKPKCVYVYRNPKDALVSQYYHSRSVGYEMDKSCEQNLAAYMEHGATTHRPFDHVAEFYALRHEPWLLYTTFERMKSDLPAVIADVCTFLNKTITPLQMQQMLAHLSFESMQNNPCTNHQWEFSQLRHKNQLPFEAHKFVRKGQVGGYREDLSPAMIAKCDEWIASQLAEHHLTLNELLLIDGK